MYIERIISQPWEFVTAIAAVFGVAFIILQLRYIRKQLTLEATLSLLSEYRRELLEDRIKFRTQVALKLRDMLKTNPKLRYSDLPVGIKETVLNLSHFHDELGLLVYRGLIDADTILSFLGDAAIDYFYDLYPLIKNERECRRSHSLAYQEYFEDMVVRLIDRPPLKRRKTKRLTKEQLEKLNQHSRARM